VPVPPGSAAYGYRPRLIVVVNVVRCVCVRAELSQQMALEKLRESMRCRQHTMLKQAIWDCERFEKLQENKEVKNANRTLAVIEARQGDNRSSP